MSSELTTFLTNNGDSINYNEVPIGTFAWWFGSESTIPSRWIKLDGSTFSVNEYPQLYTALGTNILPNVLERIIKGNSSSKINYPAIRIAGTSLTEYQASTAGYDAAHDESTEINSSIITAIPIIYAGERNEYYTDQEIDNLFASVESRVQTLEGNTGSLGEDPLSNHNEDPNAHSTLVSAKADSDSVENLISIMENIGDRMTVLENEELENENNGD